MKRLKSIVIATLAVVIAGSNVLSGATAFAQKSASLSIAPKKNYVIEPGKSVKDKLTIRNLDNAADLELRLRVVDFTFTDEGGTPKLFLAPDAPQTTWSLKPFMKVPQSVTIPKSGSKTLDMSVAIPAGHGAGSYYSAIVYSTGAPDGGNVGLSASGVTLVFTQIPGLVNEDLKLQKFGAYKLATPTDKARYLSLATEEPLNVAYTLKNNGNVTEAPTGSITLKNIFGPKYEINDVNPNGSLALIGQTRTYTACIKIKEEEVKLGDVATGAKACVPAGLWPGYYSASLDLFYGQNGNKTQEINGITSFWYLPWWFVLIVVVVLAIVGYFGWRGYRAARNRIYGVPKAKKIRRR